MSRTLLIAKSSEFENADYLDIRPLLVNAGVSDFEIVELFDTVRLKEAIPQASLIILVSGVFGDREFRATLNSELASVWQDAVAGECSILILSQLLLAQSGEPVPGMPPQLTVRPVVRPAAERKDSGRLGPPFESPNHQASFLPTTVDFANLNAKAIASSLQGLYWHWWQPANPELWQTIVTDQVAAGARGLIVEHVKANGRHRVVLSSIALDRIRDTDLLANLIQLCLGGEYSVGFVDADSSSLTSGMIVSSLKRAGVRAHLYDSRKESDITLAASALNAGIHDSLLYSPSVSLTVVNQLEASVAGGVDAGRLRVLRVTDVEPSRYRAQLDVAERSSTSDYHDCLAETRWRLSQGLIGQSIFDTAKVLGAFLDVDRDACRDQDWSQLIADLLARVRPDGSFEGPAVPTAAFVFVASVILTDTTHAELLRAAERSIDWLAVRLASESATDSCRSAVYVAKAQLLGLRIPVNFFAVIDTTTDPVNPHHALNLMLAELELGRLDDATRHASILLSVLVDDVQFGLGDQADGLVALLKLHAALRVPKESPSGHGVELLENMVATITALSESLNSRNEASAGSSSFPLTTRVAIAQESYARAVAIPTSAIVGMLSASRESTTSRKRWDDAIAFSVAAREAMDSSRAKQTALQRSVSTLRFQQRYWRLLVLALSAIALVSSALLFFAVEPEFTRFPEAWAKLIANWGVLSGLVTLLIPLLAWALFASRERPS